MIMKYYIYDTFRSGFKNRNNRDIFLNFHGYSLTEILLAILIFATTLTPLIQLFIQSSRDAESAVDSYKVSNYLAIEIERLRSLMDIQPLAFKKLYFSSSTIEKKIEKYDIKIIIDVKHKISAVSAYSGHSVSASVVEVEAAAEWNTNSGRKRRLAFNTSL